MLSRFTTSRVDLIRVLQAYSRGHGNTTLSPRLGFQNLEVITQGMVGTKQTWIRSYRKEQKTIHTLERAPSLCSKRVSLSCWIMLPIYNATKLTAPVILDILLHAASDS